MVFIKVFILSVILVLFILAGIGIKLLFGKTKNVNIGSCQAADSQYGCSCGADNNCGKLD